jgi:ABC-type branched-subunit amino acid transport system substrate-binding protein
LKQAAATGAGFGALSVSGLSGFNFVTGVNAAENPPIGTWPEGSKGNTVYVSISVPRTGAYAVQGEDELKGWELAIEHINSGHDLLRRRVCSGKK